MWALKVILLLLPAIVYCGISIKIHPSKTESKTIISFSGSDKAPISELERKTFRLDDANLKRAIKAVDEDLKLPWTCVNPRVPKVMRTLTPVGYKIIGITTKPDAIVTAEYENEHKKLDATYSTSVEKSVEEEISHGWSTSGELSVGQEINYSVDVGAASVGGSTSLSYSSGWGKEKSESRTVSLGTSSTIEVTVPPGQKVVATLSASSATLEVDIYYEATVAGFLTCDKDKDGFEVAYRVAGLQKTGRLPTKINSTEHLSISFYSNAKLKISDGQELDAEVKV